MPIPFALHPRRVVKAPAGNRALVLIRRWVPAKFSGWNGWDVRWELQHVKRLLLRDRRWCVELYPDTHDDPGGVPVEAPTHQWVVPDRDTAIAFAEKLSEVMLKEGLSDDLPQP